MKRFLFACMTRFIPVLVATNGAYAQNSVNIEIPEPQKDVIAIKKAMAPDNDRMADLSFISPKAMKNFTETYKNVTGESWQKTQEGSCAKFVSDGVRTLVYYNTRGKWTGTLKGYSEQKMPAEVRKMVKPEYYDYTITYVQEAETNESNGMPTYIINLEDKSNFRQVRIFNGQMEVWHDYKKPS